MADRQRIKKLAKRLGVDPKVVLGTLRELGEQRYKSAADILPGDLAERVETALNLAGVAQPPPPRPAPTFVPTKESPVEAAAAAEPRTPAEPEPEPEPEAEPVAAPQPEIEAPEVAAASAEALTSSPFREALSAASLDATPAEADAEADVPEAPAAAEDHAASLEAELAGLREQIGSLTRERDELKVRATDAENAWRQHDALRKDALARAEELEERVGGLEGDVKSMRKSRQRDQDEAKRREGDLREAVEDARTEPLKSLLEERGLLTSEEIERALAILMREDRASSIVRALRVNHPDRIQRALKQRLFFWCGDDACKADAPEEDRVIVPPSRCEACGGSTIRRAATAFVAACRDHGVKRVTIAGGSPNYRTAIQETVGSMLDVRVVLNGERSANQAQSDVSHSDLVVAWIATEVDHKFTGLYTSLKDPKVLHVPHRGISRMFEVAAEHVQAG